MVTVYEGVVGRRLDNTQGRVHQQSKSKHQCTQEWSQAAGVGRLNESGAAVLSVGSKGKEETTWKLLLLDNTDNLVESSGLPRSRRNTFWQHTSPGRWGRGGPRRP